ncbi:MAG TPA: DUF3891 family protein [Pirellulales bacterium]|nr:DUF3891 family protein [Pirellulales bacterium]
MIRRTYIAAEGAERWLLVPQIDHAHLAAQIARAWGAEPFDAPWPADELLAAVEHHDDGWAEWDAHPGVDPNGGRPRDFTEMRIADSVAIWQRSIDVAAAIGPLAAWVVSGHFTALLRRTNAWQPTSAAASAEADTFLGRQDAQRAHWLAEWQTADPLRHTVAAAERALEFLQFFDALSLWLCCGRQRDYRSAAPGGPALEGRQATDPQRSLDLTVRIQPWPLKVSHLRLETRARSVAAQGYAHAEALAQSASELLGLCWQLQANK